MLAIGFSVRVGLIRWTALAIFAATIEHSGRAEEALQLFGIDGALILASVAVASLGIALAWRLFGAGIGPIRVTPQPARVTAIAGKAPFLYRASLNKWWFDDLNHVLFVVIGAGSRTARRGSTGTSSTASSTASARFA